MGTALLTLGLAAAVAIAGTVVVRTIRELIEGRLGSVEERFDRRLSEVHEGFDRRLEGLDGRLLSSQQTAGQTATQIVDRLRKLDGTAAEMLQKAADLGRLEQALRPPKREAASERCCSPTSCGHAACGRLPPRVHVPVRRTRRRRDPGRQAAARRREVPARQLERLANAEGDDERELHEKAFGRDVKGHIDAIASKYMARRRNIRLRVHVPPSEAVYYELVCGKTGNLSAYAHGKRVIAVSPSTLHAYLLMVTQGLRALQIERHAQDVMAFCAQIGKDFDRFRGDFEVVGKHITNAQTKYSEADRRLERLGTSLERDGWEPGGRRGR